MNASSETAALTPAEASHHPQERLSVLALGAIGVVFGDIGTSPLYALKESFIGHHPLTVDRAHIFGVLSLIFWTMMLIVTLKYVLVILRADNKGEGGSLALLALINRSIGGKKKWTTSIVMLGVFATALFYGDSMITPAISVLSSVEGLKVVQPSLHDFVVPITAVIIVLLFLIQRRGTATVGRMFGPVMIVWFVTIGGFGVAGITQHPAILRALSPSYAVDFLAGHFGTAFFALAAIVLAVTGAEALYADMGHFGRPAITWAWLALVFPACALSYLGQGALILQHPEHVSSPFFLLAPGWARLPLVLLATAATVIASQAVITGAYSVAAQAAELGYLPRLRIAHTSESTIGQIYVPWINWLLLVAVLTLVFAFRSSAALAFAFGMAVTGTITITTLMFFYLARLRWRWPLGLLVPGAGVLLAVDLLFFGANLTKVVHGAWLPLLIALTAFTIMTTWERGRRIVTARRQRREGSLREFVEALRDAPSIIRVPGTAVFLNRGKQTAPLALRSNVEHNHVRHDLVLILSVETLPVPRVPAGERLAVDDLGYSDDRISHITVRFGYMEKPDVLSALRAIDPASLEGQPLNLATASYFLSTIELRIGDEPTMARWRKRLFIATSHITADAAEHFGLPRDRTVIMGSHIEV